MSKKSSHEIQGYFDYVVPPLEGFWQQDGIEGIDYEKRISVDFRDPSSGFCEENRFRLGDSGS